MNPIAPSELIITPAGAIYHLGIRSEQLADKVILVGDPDRVALISKHFEKIEFTSQSREFVTATGTFSGVRVTAMSSGIGCDNIDIVLNELDALANIDFENKTIKNELKSLEIVRLGTSGSLQEDIPVDSFVTSTHGLGFDGLLGFYADKEKVCDSEITKAFVNHMNWPANTNMPYVTKGCESLISKIGKDTYTGITATANGFYGPQGRELRLKSAIENQNEKLNSFSFNNHRITNFEMETSALYGLSSLLGHQAATVCTIVANRFRKEYSKDYKAAVNRLIIHVLERLTT
ncbi:MAG: nucleoside phosphorylase [Flavobacteriales bacterium]